MKNEMHFHCEKVRLLVGIFLFASLYSHAQPGLKNKNPYGVGFTVTREIDSEGNPLLISTWYPARGSSQKMALKDYLTNSKLTPDIPDDVSLQSFRKTFDRIYFNRYPNVSDASFEKIIHLPMKAILQAPHLSKKFPLIISVGTPSSYIETFEFLASQGFVVAAITTRWKDVSNDSLLWVTPTHLLELLMKKMMNQSFVDAKNIAAFGHGGGIQSAFYLAMRREEIKLLINLDGGVFGLRSKTTLSPDYNPSRLKIPMLHIVTREQILLDDLKDFNALSNVRYRVLIKSDSVMHHDFTIWGRIINNDLQQRGPSSPLINTVFAKINQLIYSFLINKRIDSKNISQELFQSDTFGN